MIKSGVNSRKCVVLPSTSCVLLKVLIESLKNIFLRISIFRKFISLIVFMRHLLQLFGEHFNFFPKQKHHSLVNRFIQTEIQNSIGTESVVS